MVTKIELIAEDYLSKQAWDPMMRQRSKIAIIECLSSLIKELSNAKVIQIAKVQNHVSRVRIESQEVFNTVAKLPDKEFEKMILRYKSTMDSFFNTTNFFTDLMVDESNILIGYTKEI